MCFITNEFSYSEYESLQVTNNVLEEVKIYPSVENRSLWNESISYESAAP